MSGGWGHGLHRYFPLLPQHPGPRPPTPARSAPSTDGEAGLSHTCRRVWPRTKEHRPAPNALGRAAVDRVHWTNSENCWPGKGNYWTSPGEPPPLSAPQRHSRKQRWSHLSHWPHPRWKADPGSSPTRKPGPALPQTGSGQAVDLATSSSATWLCVTSGQSHCLLGESIPPY